MGASNPVEIPEKSAICPSHGEYVSKGLQLSPGRAFFWTSCGECAREAQLQKEQAEREKAEVQRQRAIENAIQRAGIPVRFKGKKLSSFVADSAGKAHALEVSRKFVEDFSRHMADGTTVVFSGKPGTGKSHLAMAIAQELLPGTSAMYSSAMDIIRMIRDTWRRDSPKSEREIIDLLGSVGLLIVDEVGVQFGSDAEKVHMFDVINRRYEDQMPTIFLTNLDKKGLKEFVGERAFDRMRESGMWVPFDWESYRTNGRS